MKDYDFYYTQDGSIGLYSYEDNDVYHSKYGALTEAWEKFVIPSGIAKRLNQCEELNVLDVCYGVGYNTKALMSYVINTDEKLLKRKNIFIIFFQKIKKFFDKKNIEKNNDIDSIDSDNIIEKKEENLSLYIESNNSDNIISSESQEKEILNTKYIETYDLNNLSKVNIDCLDIKDELIKISPLLKTVLTPQEIYEKFIPRFLDCFDTYWILREKLSKFTLKIALRNKKKITELLDLKYSNDYDLIDKDYKIHKFVNHILVDSLIEKYGNKYIDKELKKKLRKKGNRKFFDNSMINYAKNKQCRGYNLFSKLNLMTFLHNIYYDYLSKRYKKMKYEIVTSLFNINFYVNDARKTILDLDKRYDFIFLDAFTYSKAPELWSAEFLAELYARLSSKGVLMTYSTSALVRNTLLENNFFVGNIFDIKTNKVIGTIAAREKSLIEHPLSNYELGLCGTKAGIPYRDPGLNLPKDEILKRRKYEFLNSELMSATKYMKHRTSKQTGDEDGSE